MVHPSPCGRVPPPNRSTSGRGGSRTRASTERDGTPLSSPIPREWGSSCGHRDRRRAADRRPSRGPEGAGAPGLRLRARVRRPPRPSRRLFENALDFQPLDDFVLGDPRRRSRLAYLLRRAPSERGVPGAGTVHHVAWASQTRITRRGATGRRGRRASDAGHRPLLLHRSTSASRAASSSRSPPSAPASLPTSRSSTWASASRSRRLRASPRQLEPILTPLPDPRAVRAQ